MSRRREVDKHPALAVRGEVVAEAMELALEEEPGWNVLNGDERRFLVAYVYWGDYEKAADVAGIGKERIGEYRKRKAEFERLVGVVRERPKELATAVMEGMLPLTIEELHRILEGAPDNVRLQAIKHIHEALGLTKQDTGLPQGQFIQVNVKNFRDD